MNKTTCILLIALLSLTGCAVNPTTGKSCTPAAPTSANAAEVVVYRPYMLQGSGVPYGVAIDNCLIGELQSDSLIRYKVASGKRRIQAKDAEILAELKPGTTSYVRFWLRNTGKQLYYFHGPVYEHVPAMVIVDKATAEQEIKKLRQPEN